MPTFYEIISYRTNWREKSWNTKNPLVLLILFVLWLFKIRTPNACDDPHVDSILPFAVSELPPEIAQRFIDLTAELASFGFCGPVFHAIEDPVTGIRIYWASFRHVSGQSIARIHNRYWDTQTKKERAFFPLFITEFADATFLVSSSGKPDAAEPPTVEMNRQPGLATAALWAQHQQLVAERSATKQVWPVNYREDIPAVAERLHVLQRDFHLARGYFRERTAQEQASGATFSATIERARADGLPYPEAMAEFDRLQEQKPAWRQGIWLLVVSLVVFLVAGSQVWDWKWTLWLVPVLLFHEAGHWVAMRTFGYRDMRMFFIPFFGAAVSGRNLNAAGWKKAIVSLAGPLPGIVLGTILAIVAGVGQVRWLKPAASMLVFMNAFNLLPLLPFDGGRFLHAVLFCRNRWLSILFQAAAVAGLLGLSMAGVGNFTLYLGIIFAIGLPTAYKVAKVTDRVRGLALPPPLPNQDRISTATAAAIIHELKTAMPSATPNKLIAQHAINVSETLNARPPGALATLGLLATYLGSVGVSVVCLVFLAVGGSDSLQAALRQPRHRVSDASSQTWQGADAKTAAASSQDLIVSTFRRPSQASKEFQTLTTQLPATASLILYGDTVLVGFPAADATAAESWLARLRADSTNTFLAPSTNPPVLRMTFLAPDLPSATNLEKMLDDSFDATMSVNAPLPWNPRALAPDFLSKQQARHVWHEIDAQMDAAQAEANGTNDSNRFMRALRGGSNQLQQLIEEEQSKVAKLQDRRRQTLLVKYGSTPFADLIHLQEELSLRGETNAAARLAARQKLGEALGVAPDDSGRAPDISALPERHALLFELPVQPVRDAQTSLPGVVRWLTEHHCSGIRYEFIPADADD